MQKRVAIFLAFFALCVTWVPQAFGQTLTPEGLSQAMETLRDRVGSYRCSYELDIRNVLPEYDPDHEFELSASMNVLTSGSRYFFESQRESTYFADVAMTSPPELRDNESHHVFDGQYYRNVEFRHRRASIALSADPLPHPHPNALWLDPLGTPIEDYLRSPNARALEDIDGASAGTIVVEAPLMNGVNDNVIRLHFDATRGYFPIRREVGGLQPDGSLDVRSSMEVLEIGETDDGTPFPKEVVQNLYMSLDGRKLRFNSRIYRCQLFEANVAVSEGDFELDVPRGFKIKDEVIGISYRSGENDTESLSNIENALEKLPEDLSPSEENLSADSGRVLAEKTVASGYIPVRGNNLIRYGFFFLALVGILASITFAVIGLRRSDSK